MINYNLALHGNYCVSNWFSLPFAYKIPDNLIHLTAMTPAKPSETARPTYNENDYERQAHLSH